MPAVLNSVCVLIRVQQREIRPQFQIRPLSCMVATPDASTIYTASQAASPMFASLFFFGCPYIPALTGPFEVGCD